MRMKLSCPYRAVSCTRLTLLFSMLTCTAVAQIAAPAPAGKGSAEKLNMLDARVNYRPVFDHSASARPGALQNGLLQARSIAKGIASAVVSFQKSRPEIEIRISNLTGAPGVVNAKVGALTTSAPGKSSEAIARDFLYANAKMFGLTDRDMADLVALGDSAGTTRSVRMLRMEQRIDGRPIFQSETRFVLKRDGSLVEVLGQMVPDAHASASQVDWSQALSAPQAAADLLNASGVAASAADFSVDADHDGQLELAQTNAALAGPLTARQVFFPLAPGVLVPAWSIVAFTTGDQDWYAIVDAQTGDLLWRKNIRNYVSTHDARFRVYVQADGTTPADSPAPLSPTNATIGSNTQPPGIAPTIVSMFTAMNATASPNGWIDDCPGGVCTANETQTLGNNVLACLDRVGGANANICDTAASSVLDGNGRPTGNSDANGRNRDFLGTAPRDFQTNFLPPPQGGNPEAGQTPTGNGNNGTLAVDQFRRGMLTQLFYVSNWYHDRLYALGFDEASGNFQQTNFTGMSLGNDRVLAEGQDSSGTNNSNFSTPPDGQSGRAQMFRFIGPTVDRDGSLDSEILIHELTHGISNRLIGNAAGLIWDPGVGMGEGWSDFYALSLLNNTNADDPNGSYASGAYATYKAFGITTYTDNYLYGIRRFPYSTNNSVNPLTWADVDDTKNDLSGGIAPDPLGNNTGGALEVHNIGEIWALTLWEVRSRIIADPAGANGDVPTGNQTMLQLVTDAMKMTPVSPSFVDSRDALFDADCATNACANEALIWDGFADRGLGYGAKAPNTRGFAPVASHMGIVESFSSPYLDVINPATDVTIDDSASNNNGTLDPGEPVKLTVTLTNPWRAAGKSVAGATATLSTTTADVAIIDSASSYGAIAPLGTATGDTFTISVGAGVPCGSAIDFTITTVSSLGTTSTSFQLRVGAANGTDSVITYTRTPGAPLAIQDNRPRGVADTLNIVDDRVIADIDFRVDSLPHTFPGDVTVALYGPTGYGNDLIDFIGGAVAGGGDGDNITNMVIDDEATGDMLLATNAQAPYTGSWMSIANSTSWPALGFGPQDPIGSLARFDGTSTKGTWTTLVSDQATADTGTLNGWSLLVTPVHFDCTVFTPAVAISATKTVSSTFHVGDTVTYTVTLTNNGTANQADNAGDEFTDVLPATLTLVSANATAGTAVASLGTNTITWDGSLAPLGGNVTITITATINNGAQGTISNQGTVSYDTDGDGTNESTVLTDDPGIGGASDPTSFDVQYVAIAATKTVSGTFHVGDTVTYTVTLSNTGNITQADNAGDEFTDVLPAALTLVSANATAGTAVASLGTNTVTWDGSIANGGNVTITITATINPGTDGTMVVNQGTVSYDTDGNGTNESTVLTDDPGIGGASDSTNFTVIDLIFANGFE